VSNFTPLVLKEYDFDGDHIVIQFSRLKVKDLLTIVPSFSEIVELNVDESNATELLTKASDVFASLETFSELIIDYVKSVDGLTDSVGNDIGIEIIVSESYFLKLYVKLLVDMISESSTIQDKEGKD
jgi:hypothetical protein